ncbi:hypothetical protein CMV_018504 [Castanea mollissima]|uniref:Uncharacterized protein n=1 Tax=Castanea mollissima TaxID=60419 RepID=A0A8J4QRG9_9ROSI|nr:hypothetical protein CMV_018504 [Castanea mollissima]
MGREIVRQESPNILKTRSRLWYHEDAREVLTGSKGSDKIRGIMWHSPYPIPVQLHAKAFKKMENLKLLMMPHSCIRLKKLFKQGHQYNNLKSINLGRLFNQFLEISMDPSFWYYDRCKLILPRIEIPKAFKLNHQSVGNSVSFVVGREFQKLMVCFAFRSAEAKLVEFVVSTNGFLKTDEAWVGSISGEHLLLRPVYLGGWNKSNPSEQNHVTITVEIRYSGKSSSSDDPKITWLGVHVDCICPGCGSSSVPDDIDHHSFPSDVGLQMDTTNGLDLPMGHPSLGFTYGLDDQDSSTIARICDNTEPPPLPAIFSTPYGSDLDHGVSNTGGVSGLLIDPNFESSFHDDVHDLDLSASRDGCPPLVLDDIEHHCLPSDALPVDTTNGSELGLGRQDLRFSDGFDQGSSSVAHAFDNNNFDFNLFPPSKKARTS